MSSQTGALIAHQINNIRQLQHAANYQQALTQCQKLLKQHPNLTQVLRVKAELHNQLSEPQAALETLEQVSKLLPKHHAVHCDLAGQYYRMGHNSDAEYHARQALALNPKNPQAHNLLGQIMAQAYLFEEAVFHYRQVLLLHEPLPALCSNLGNALVRLGQLQEAVDSFRMGYELDPKDLALLLSWLRMEEIRQQFDRAWELLTEAEAIAANDTTLLVLRARLLYRQKQYTAALSTLDKVHIGVSAENHNYEYYFTRGDILDALGQYDKAMAAYHQGNRRIIAAEKFHYQPAEQQLLVNLQNSFKTVTLPKSAPKASSPLPKPVFIVGFPRSGTTLVEQIITSHPEVCAGDELSFLNRSTQLAGHFFGNNLPYPRCFTQFDASSDQGQRVLEKFRTYYLQNVMSRNILTPGSQLFTDKMPLNERHLGLIHMAFPDSPIVHVIRHPVDVVLSSYFNQLTHGGNCSFDLETAAKHYASVYQLIKHYEATFELNMQRVKYEDLVAQPKQQVEALINFIDLPWDESCLKFSENRRYARTASYAQVTEPLYEHACYRHQNYLKHVQKIARYLEPITQELGYPSLFQGQVSETTLTA